MFGAGGPQAVAADAQGTVYATDPAANQVERFTRSGDLVSPGWRGSGGPDAPLSNPRGIDVDPFGTVYVADADRIARYSPTGGFLDAAHPLAQPQAVATDAAGNAFVVVAGRVQQLDPRLGLGGSFAAGPAAGIAVDGGGNVYLSIGAQVREYTGTGTPVATFSAGTAPAGLAVDEFGDVYVADGSSIDKLAPGGAQLARLTTPSAAHDVTLDPDGSVVAALDTGLERWVAVAPDTTLDTAPSGLIDDPSPQFTFSSPTAGASFECRIAGSGDDWAPCTSPFTASGLAAGLNRFEVRAVDAQGIRDRTPAVAEFSEDGAQGPPGFDGFDGLPGFDGERGPRGRRGKPGGLIVKGKVLRGLRNGTSVRLGLQPSIALRRVRVELRLGSSHGTIVAEGARKRLAAGQTTVVRLRVVQATSAKKIALVVHGRTARDKAVLLARRLR